MPAKTGLLLKLAQLYGIQTAYYGIHHKRNPVQAETLLAVLQSLDAPITSLNDVADAYRSRKQALYQKFIEPITVAWEGKLDSITIRLPDNIAEYRNSIYLIMEDGTQSEWHPSHRDLSTVRQIEIDNTTYYEKILSLKKQLPIGYHRLVIEVDSHRAETLILSAPIKAFNTANTERHWGTFIPLYSLHSAKSWGAGNFSDMKEFTGWVGNQGGNSVASLPLLSTFLDKPYEPSPYLPISKLFWNEFYLDITKIPELPECPDAEETINSPSFIQTIQSFQRAHLVDFFQQMALKRNVLEQLSNHFFSHDSPAHRNFKRYVATHPVIEKYANFRATMEKENKPWYQWQERLQNGNLKPGDYDEKAKGYHLYVQWLAHQQMNDLVKYASDRGIQICLDLPLGTHPDGFDTWQYRQIFVNSVSVGAPPDIVFTRGQDWTFPPLHPDIIRDTGYEYFIACVRHHLQYARTLRIDHIMSLYRLFFIPKGFESSQGMYVRYHSEELYAILSIESHRHKSILIGEDLGIVPKVVRTAMIRHGLHRMWVMHYEMVGNSKPFLRSPSPYSVVSLNTHDMPPFASFWKGQDIIDRERTGIITRATARKEKKSRIVTKGILIAFLKDNNYIKGRITAASILKGCLAYLAVSSSQLLLINIEDLWLETRAQNIPSTTTEHANWRRKARLSFEAFCQIPQIVTILGEINRLRSSEGNKRAAKETKERNQI